MSAETVLTAAGIDAPIVPEVLTSVPGQVALLPAMIVSGSATHLNRSTQSESSMLAVRLVVVLRVSTTLTATVAGPVKVTPKSSGLTVKRYCPLPNEVTGRVARLAAP